MCLFFPRHTTLCCQSDTELINLTKKLISDAKTEVNKVKSIFEWVTKNIKYDHETARNNISKTKTTSEILKSRKAICTGYAALIKAMCNEVGMVCHVVSGYAYTPSSVQNTYERPNHAWNAVLIDGYWYLMDATWSSSVHKNSYSKGSTFFMTDPKLMIKTHMPAQRWWQLLYHPVSFENFKGEKKSYPDTSTYYYQDTIAWMYKGTNNMIKINEALEAATFNPSPKNKLEYSSVLMEIAGLTSDSLAVVMDTSDIGWLHGRMDYILGLCRMSSQWSDLLPSQKELYVEVLLNYTASLYNRTSATPRKNLIEMLDEAKRVLDSTPDTYYTAHARQVIAIYEKTIK